MTDNKNTFLAIVLSAIVLLAGSFSSACRRWRSSASRRSSKQQDAASSRRPARRRPAPGTAPAPGTRAGTAASRARRRPPRPTAPGGPGATRARRCSPRARASRSRAPQLKGSIALKGGRIDDLALMQYRETVNPKSPAIVLLSPSGTEHPFYAEFGWVRGGGVDREGAGRRDGLAPGGRRRAHAGQAGHAHLGQRRGPRIPPHHRGRRQVPVHRQGRGEEQRARRRSRCFPMR